LEIGEFVNYPDNLKSIFGPKSSLIVAACKNVSIYQ